MKYVLLEYGLIDLDCFELAALRAIETVLQVRVKWAKNPLKIWSKGKLETVLMQEWVNANQGIIISL